MIENTFCFIETYFMIFTSRLFLWYEEERKDFSLWWVKKGVPYIKFPRNGRGGSTEFLKKARPWYRSVTLLVKSQQIEGHIFRVPKVAQKHQKTIVAYTLQKEISYSLSEIIWDYQIIQREEAEVTVFVAYALCSFIHELSQLFFSCRYRVESIQPQCLIDWYLSQKKEKSEEVVTSVAMASWARGNRVGIELLPPVWRRQFQRRRRWFFVTKIVVFLPLLGLFVSTPKKVIVEEERNEVEEVTSSLVEEEVSSTDREEWVEEDILPAETKEVRLQLKGFVDTFNGAIVFLYDPEAEILFRGRVGEVFPLFEISDFCAELQISGEGQISFCPTVTIWDHNLQCIKTFFLQ